MEVVLFIAGAGFGAALVLLLGRGARSRADAILAERERRAGEMREELVAARGRESDLRREIAALGAEHAAIKASLQAERRGTEEKLLLVEESRKKLQDTLPGASADLALFH